MVRFVEVTDGLWHFWCPGCGFVHGFNDRWDFDRRRETVRPSLLVTGGADRIVCHMFITNGMIEYLPDSTHHLSGKTIPVPNWDLD